MQTIDHETGEVTKRNESGVLETPSPIALSETGLTVDGELSFEEWHDFGQSLQRVEGAIQWWIGDWLNYGEFKWGEKYAQAVDDTGMGYQALANYKWVSKSIQFSTRVENLSWAHHREVAKFDPDQQRCWLDLAESEPLTVAQLRREIKAAKAIAALPEPSANGRATMRVYEGDSLAIMPTLPHQSFSLLLTDPPYNTRRMDWDTWDQDCEFIEWTQQWVGLALPLMADEYNAFVFCSPNNAADIEIDVLRKLGLTVKSRIIWNHRNMSMGRDVSDRFINTYDVCLHFGTAPLNWPIDWDDKRFDVQLFAAPQTNFEDTKLHQTQKPIELIKLLCSVGSSIGGNVLDPFSGAGTTGAACLELGRNCTMIDLEFADLSAKRVGVEVSHV